MTSISNTKKIVYTALMLALCFVLSFIEIPLFPPAPWLKFDFCAVVCMLCGLTAGIVCSIFVAIASAIFHGLCVGDPFGAIMQSIFCVFWCIPTLLIIKNKFSIQRLSVSLIISGLFVLVLILGANLLITPLYTGTTIEQTALLIVPVILPFNLLKIAIDTAVFVAVRKPYLHIINNAFYKGDSN